MQGMYIYWMEADPDPNMVYQLREFTNNALPNLNISTSPIIYDVREFSYKVNEIALSALFDPDMTQKGLSQAGIVDSINNVYTPREFCVSGAAPPCNSEGGGWLNPTNGNATWNGGTGFIQVHTGDTVVQGSGTNFTTNGCQVAVPNLFNADNFWAKTGRNSPVSNTEGLSNMLYTITACTDNTHITIDPAWAGPDINFTDTTVGWQIGNVLGVGVEPFIYGVVASALYNVKVALATDYPTESALAETYMLDAWNFLTNSSSGLSYNPTYKSFYYGVYFVNCLPGDQEVNPNCGALSMSSSSRDIQGGRGNSPEAMGSGGIAYTISSNAAILSLIEKMIGGVYGGLGGPESDIYYGEDALGRWGQQGQAIDGMPPQAKILGFYYGWGRDATAIGVYSEATSPMSAASKILGKVFGTGRVR